MDKLARYRGIIKDILQRHARHKPSVGTIEDVAVCDEATDTYLLASAGWFANGKRQHGFPIHVRLRDGKFWIEWDGTEYGVAQELLDAGVPKEDIVLAFYSYETRKLTDFAAA
jgi:hypothetical protein